MEQGAWSMEQGVKAEAGAAEGALEDFGRHGELVGQLDELSNRTVVVGGDDGKLHG